MTFSRLEGLIAATFSPLQQNGSLDLKQVPCMTDFLIRQGVNGLYVCGSTGEGMSLSGDERRQMTEAWVQAASGRAPVIVQVGHNSTEEARQLSEHAQRTGADAVSATCPSYFKVHDVETLIECMQPVAAGAPDLPFYYYHIPSLTGSALDVADFLRRAVDRIPNLAGLKYTDTALHEFQRCVELNDGQFDVVWGCDEMLLGALATGTRGAIGSTYNVAAPLYRELIDAFHHGDLVLARSLQSKSVEMVHVLMRYPFHAAMKEVLRLQGMPCGPCRPPQRPLSGNDATRLQQELSAIGIV